jgi:hypothetical protein
MDRRDRRILVCITDEKEGKTRVTLGEGRGLSCGEAADFEKENSRLRRLAKRARRFHSQVYWRMGTAREDIARGFEDENCKRSRLIERSLYEEHSAADGCCQEGLVLFVISPHRLSYSLRRRLVPSLAKAYTRAAMYYLCAVCRHALILKTNTLLK